MREKKSPKRERRKGRKASQTKARLTSKLDLFGGVLDAWAVAEEVGISVSVVDSTDRRPELLLSKDGERVRGFGSGVRSVGNDRVTASVSVSIKKPAHGRGW
jgi:hypothetical protein